MRPFAYATRLQQRAREEPVEDGVARSFAALTDTSVGPPRDRRASLVSLSQRAKWTARDTHLRLSHAEEVGSHSLILPQ